MALPGRCCTGAAVLRGGKCVFVAVVIEMFAGVREVVVALKLVVSAPFEFVSDDPH